MPCWLLRLRPTQRARRFWRHRPHLLRIRRASFRGPGTCCPAILFFAAAIAFRYRIKKDEKSASIYDYSLFIVALLNVVCHVSAAFSRHLFDGPFFLAELSKTASYVVMLCGALLDQARLFDQVRSHGRQRSAYRISRTTAVSSVFEAELDRSRRTQRAFQRRASRHGRPEDHQRSVRPLDRQPRVGPAGQRFCAIIRRAIDTAARYGGDEFALVLPEAGRDIATRVVSRIREKSVIRSRKLPRFPPAPAWPVPGRRRHAGKIARRCRSRPVSHEAPRQQQRTKSYAHCCVPCEDYGPP